MCVPCILYRNTKTEYAEAFVKEGKTRFCPLTYYRSLEDNTRGDPHDGQFYVEKSPKRVAIRFKDLPAGHSLSGQWVEHKAIGDVALTISAAGSEHTLISCFSITQQPKFGSGCIEVFDVAGMLQHFADQLKKVSLQFKYGCVEYYSSESRKPSDETLWLNKRVFFSPEQEYRLAIPMSTENLSFYSKQGLNFDGKIGADVEFGSLEKFCRLV